MLIKTKNNTPDIYTEESRDFQLLECIFDLIFNSSASNISKMDFLRYTENIDTKLLNTLADYLGFFTNIYYPDELLRSVLVNFPDIINCKGTIKSIEMAAKALQNAYTNKSQVQVAQDGEDKWTYHVNTVGVRVNPIYLEDILRFIRPVGLIITEQLQATLAMGYETLIADINEATTLSANVNNSNDDDLGIYFGQIRNKADLNYLANSIAPDSLKAKAIANKYISRVNHTQIKKSFSQMFKILVEEDNK